MTDIYAPIPQFDQTTQAVFQTAPTVDGNGNNVHGVTVVASQYFYMNMTTETIRVGGSAQLAVVAPTVVLGATWTSDTPGVCTVNAMGKITGVSPGTANITATKGSNSTSCAVTVTA